MKHLKTYESFGMNKSNCDRCGESTNGVTTMTIISRKVFRILLQYKSRKLI